MATIAVLDDEPEVREVVARMVQAGGYSVLELHPTPELPSELLRHRFNVLITDLTMPHMDGWQVARWMSQHRPGVPLIALSGVANVYRPGDAVGMFAGVLSKPIRKPELLSIIQTVVPR
jgi:CheY-like chemotaxis protein